MTATTDTDLRTSSSRLRFDVRPMSGHIGAEILGIDLAESLSAELVAAIRETLLRWKVVFFRDQHMNQARHIEFGRLFGEVTPAHPTLPAAFTDHPEILLLDNELVALSTDDTVEYDNPWHTDVTFLPNPPMASILRGVIVPDYGGDTQWINLVAAYDALSDPIKAMIDGLHAVHRNVVHTARGDVPSHLQKLFASRNIRAVHPVVRVHPETGEKALFVNPGFTTHILELTRRESRHLLDLLFEHMTTPKFTVRFRWAPGSIAFWDNRATAHIVPGDVPAGTRRSMERITLAGDVPVGPDGSTSYALEEPSGPGTGA